MHQLMNISSLSLAVMYTGLLESAFVNSAVYVAVNEAVHVIQQAVLPQEVIQSHIHSPIK